MGSGIEAVGIKFFRPFLITLFFNRKKNIVKAKKNFEIFDNYSPVSEGFSRKKAISEVGRFHRAN